MKEQAIKIALLAPQDGEAVAAAEGLEKRKGLRITKRAEHLAKVNGNGVALAKSHDIIVFHAGSVDDADLKAISGMKAEGKSAKLVAIASETMKVSDLFRLRNAGVTEVIPDSITPDDLYEQLLSYAKSLSAEARSGEAAQTHPHLRRGRIIAVTQSLGGIGSTTVAANLADQLQERSSRFSRTEANKVVLVDLDIQFGTIAAALDLEANELLFDLAMNGDVPDAFVIEEAVHRMDSGLAVLAAPDQFAPLDALKPEQLKALIANLRLRFDYIVVDLPRALVDWLSPLVQETDLMLMVTDTSVPSIRQAHRLIRFYTEEKNDLEVQIVVNREAKPLFKRRHHKAAEKALERSLMHWLPEDPRAAGKTIDHGAPVSKVARRSALNKSISRLGRSARKTLEETKKQPKVVKE